MIMKVVTVPIGLESTTVTYVPSVRVSVWRVI